MCYSGYADVTRCQHAVELRSGCFMTVFHAVSQPQHFTTTSEIMMIQFVDCGIMYLLIGYVMTAAITPPPLHWTSHSLWLSASIISHSLLKQYSITYEGC